MHAEPRCSLPSGFPSALGLFNGWLAVAFRLPALVVTLGTMALYRGAGQILLGDRSTYGFPLWFISVDFRYIPGNARAVPARHLLPLCARVFPPLAPDDFWPPGIRHRRQPAGLPFFGDPRRPDPGSRLYPVGPDGRGRGTDDELPLCQRSLGYGQRLRARRDHHGRAGRHEHFRRPGTIAGTVLALFVIGTLRYAMGLANVLPQNQGVVIGLLLVMAVLLPELWPAGGRILSPGPQREVRLARVKVRERSL